MTKLTTDIDDETRAHAERVTARVAQSVNDATIVGSDIIGIDIVTVGDDIKLRASVEIPITLEQRSAILGGYPLVEAGATS